MKDKTKLRAERSQQYRLNQQAGIWDAARISFDECVDMTVDSIKEIEGQYDTWVFTWSGGKDSTTLVTLLISLINSGQILAPKRIKILIADTRMELIPLWVNAMKIKEQLANMDYDVEVVTSDIDRRFWVYMLGYGVPPPPNSFRWCTSKLKIDPVERAIREYVATVNDGRPEHDWNKVLLMTGVRVGESAARDARIKMSCSKNGSECGQGHYHHISRGWIDQLAPLIHWRVCAIWDWLSIYAPMAEFGSWDTALLAQAYGGEEAEEKNARTGCIGCNLVSKDKALLEIVKIPEWDYLSPLLELRKLYAWLKFPENRLRKTGFQTTKRGNGASNQNRVGPITMKARKEGLERLLALIARVNKRAVKDNRPQIDIINAEEINRIHWHWQQGSWPQGWTGDETVANLPFTQFYADGSSQDSLF